MIIMLLSRLFFVLLISVHFAHPFERFEGNNAEGAVYVSDKNASIFFWAFDKGKDVSPQARNELILVKDSRLEVLHELFFIYFTLFFLLGLFLLVVFKHNQIALADEVQKGVKHFLVFWEVFAKLIEKFVFDKSSELVLDKLIVREFLLGKRTDWNFAFVIEFVRFL